MVVDNRPCILEIIDTAGRGEYAALREDYIRDGDAFIIAYSVTSRKSFSHVRAYYNNIKQVKKDMEVEHTLKLSPSKRPVRSPIILVGTKTDVQAQREVSYKEGRMLSKSLDCWFYETSPKCGSDVERAFSDVIRCFRQENLPGHPKPSASKRSRKGQHRRKVHDPRRCIVS
jgi:GTPase KRas protein